MPQAREGKLSELYVKQREEEETENYGLILRNNSAEKWIIVQWCRQKCPSKHLEDLEPDFGRDNCACENTFTIAARQSLCILR